MRANTSRIIRPQQVCLVQNKNLSVAFASVESAYRTGFIEPGSSSCVHPSYSNPKLCFSEFLVSKETRQDEKDLHAQQSVFRHTVERGGEGLVMTADYKSNRKCPESVQL